MGACQKDEALQSPGADENIRIVYDQFQDKDILVFGSNMHDFFVSFEARTEKGSVGKLQPLRNQLPIIAEDSAGNLFDVFGKVISGPRKGEGLIPLRSYMGYWFAFAAVFPNAEIFEGPQPDTILPEIELLDDWLIPTELVMAGGSSGGVPALYYPEMISTTGSGLFEQSHLNPAGRVLGVKLGKESRAYPLSMLNYHEVINDSIGSKKFVVTYCPLTGTGISWDKEIDGQDLEFYVSGLVFNGNVIPGDHQTNSLWSQMKMKCVNGDLIGTEAELLTSLETTLGNWLIMYPGTKFVSSESGYDFDYSIYPYDNYREEEYLSYPVRYIDKRLHPKERVHGVVINDKVKVYRFKDF